MEFEELSSGDTPLESFGKMEKLYDAMVVLYKDLEGIEKFMRNFCSYCGKPYSDGCVTCGD